MERGIIFFTAQWFTIQPDLFGRIEDKVGELGESEKDKAKNLKKRAYAKRPLYLGAYAMKR